MNHIKQIDGLRALAVTAVLINHLYPSVLPGGYLGVDLFFVISGYVISLSLYGSQRSNGSSQILLFFFKRIFRILPILLLVVGVFSLLVCAFSAKPLGSLLTGGWSLLGVSNIYLARASSSYFSEATLSNPFVHTWSLGIEEQFYLLFPFLLSGCGVLSSDRCSIKGLRACAMMLAVFGCFSFVLAALKGQMVAASNFYLPQYRFWEIAFGAALFFFLATRTSVHRNGALVELRSVLGLLGIFFAFLIPSEFSFGGSTVMVVSALLLVSSFNGYARIDDFLSNKLFAAVSKRSYSLYLWHWPLISIAFLAYGISFTVSLVVLALTIIFSCASYSLVEQPCIRFSRRLVHDVERSRFQLRVLNLMISALLLVSGGALAIMKVLPGLALNVYAKFNGISFSSIDTKGDPLILFRQGSYWKESDDPEIRLIVSCFFEVSFDSDDAMRCLNARHDLADSVKAAYLIGDSHATNYSFGVKKALGSNYQFRHFTLGMCGFVAPEDAYRFVERSRSCLDYSRVVLQHFRRSLDSGDLVFLSMTWNDDPFYFKSSKSYIPDGTFRMIGELARIVSERGARLVLIDDVPGRGDPSVCGPRWYRPWSRDDCSVSYEALSSSRSGYYRRVEDLVRRYPSVYGLSVVESFCRQGLCSVDKNGTPLYIDQGHLNVSASWMIADKVSRLIASEHNLRR